MIIVHYWHQSIRTVGTDREIGHVVQFLGANGSSLFVYESMDGVIRGVQTNQANMAYAFGKRPGEIRLVTKSLGKVSS